MRDLLVIEPRWLAELVPHYYEYKAAKTDGARLLQLPLARIRTHVRAQRRRSACGPRRSASTRC
jgi:hypothetical protein